MEHNSSSPSTQTLPDAETLRDLYQRKGKTIRHLAAHYHCRPATLLALMNDAGIARRRPGRVRATLPDWDRAGLQRLVKVQGMPYVRTFARAHGVSTIKLTVLVGERVLPRGEHSRRRLGAHDGAIRRAYDDGTAISDLAHRYGCSRRTIYYSLERTSGNQCASKTNSFVLLAH